MCKIFIYSTSNLLCLGVDLYERYKSNQEFCAKNLGIVDQLIGLVGRVFTNDLGDWGSIPGWVILKTWKMVLDTS